MAFVDGTVVNVALPVMQRALHAGVEGMQWVVEAYTLFLAALVLPGGALGDRLGRRRVFVAGVVLFAGASAACGAAPDTTLLVAARALQGVGGALLVPGSLSLITAAYPEPERGAAIGTWSAVTSIAAAVGPVAGGWVVAHASWRWIFYFNVPLGAIVAVLATRRVEETRDEGARGPLDVAGTALAVVGLGVLVWALLEAPAAGGLAAPRTVALLVAAFGALVGFVIVEARARSPLVPLALFRSPTFAGTNLATLLLYAALGAVFFFLPFDLVQVQRYSPAEAGAALLPFVVLLSAMSRWAGRLVPRFGARLPLVVGPVLAGVGFALLALPGTGGTYVATFFPAVVVLGFGMGLTVAPLTTAVMGSVDSRHAGVASGINNAVARAAGLLAIAALGLVLVARFDAALDVRMDALRLEASVRAAVDVERSKLAAADVPAFADAATRAALRSAFDDAFVAGFRAVSLACAGLAFAAAAAAWWLVGRERRVRG